MNENTQNIAIDAIIPWVDGNDKKWQEKINQFSKVKIDFNNKKESVRFNNIGEINICIKSIIKNAPFVRNIYLVTDEQKPDSFNTLETLAHKASINLEIVNHKALFIGFESYLPSFNSRSIESLFINIPNLAENFIVFNDDTFLMRKTKPKDFFVNKNPVIRGKWEIHYENQYLKNIVRDGLANLNITKTKDQNGNKRVMQNSAKLAGLNKYIRRYHTPSSIRKSTLTNFFKDNNLLEKNIKHRFRHHSQFMLSSLSEHLEVKNGTDYFQKSTRLTYFRSYKSFIKIKLKLLWFTINKNKVFVTCQSLEMANGKSQKYILDWINKRLN